jgi:DeoR/GlpR family transcriptional regulator of sugar metabolism
VTTHVTAQAVPLDGSVSVPESAEGLASVSVIERRAQIAALVELMSRVSVADLAARFGVTDVSIRRDLTVLEEQGLLRRVHGGAVTAPPEHGRSAYALRERTARGEKRRIGIAAAALIGQGDVVVFDSGSTVAQVAAQIDRPLRRSNALTVVTNSLPVLDEVGRWESPHLVCLGGLYLPDHQSLVGPQTVADLQELSADIAFLGCDGLTARTGLTTPHVLAAEVGAVIASRSRRVVVVADSTKIGREGFTRIIPLAEVHVLVTNVGADPDEIERARGEGVEVILA